MAIEIVPFEEKHMPAVRHFAERVWRRPTSNAFYRWRYERPHFHSAYLALSEGKCLAMECAIRRPYRIGAETVEFLEVFDWFALPELRNAGQGVRVMQRFMRDADPLLLVGGTSDTQGLLPRLKWQIVGQADRWVLPLGAQRLAEGIRARLQLPAPAARVLARAALARPGRTPRRRAVPEGAAAFPVAEPGPELFELYRGDLGYGTVATWTPEILRWLICGFAGIGHFIPIYFEVNAELRGWALLRILRSSRGTDAEIIDLFAPSPDADLYTWMVSEVATVAASFAPGALGACTSCSVAQEAFRRNNFVRTQSYPIQLWWPTRGVLPTPMSLGSNTGDTAIVPLPEKWWGDTPG